MLCCYNVHVSKNRGKFSRFPMHHWVASSMIYPSYPSKFFQLSVPANSHKCVTVKFVVPENIHTPPRKVTGNSEGEGGSKAEISEGSGGFIGSSFSRG